MSLVVQFEKSGGPEVLQYVDVPIPAPGDGEVRIKASAIGLNRAEAMWREDAYIEPVVYPARLGYEVVGVVDAVGAGVIDIKIGDVVNTIPSFSMNQYGMYGEVVLAPAYSIVQHPTALTHTEAASIWMMFITAYGALIEDAKLTSDDAIIITAASSSVALAAIQLANLAGAKTIALTRTSAKKQRLLDAGAQHVIATEEEDLIAEVMRITEGKGARVVFDPVGGSTLEKLLAAMAPLGTLYLYGALATEPTILPVLSMIGKMPTIKGHNIWLTSGNPVRQKQAVEFILNGIETGRLKPIIDRTFKFNQIVEAHEYMEANEQFGKIVIKV